MVKNIIDELLYILIYKKNSLHELEGKYEIITEDKDYMHFFFYGTRS